MDLAWVHFPESRFCGPNRQAKDIVADGNTCPANCREIVQWVTLKRDLAIRSREVHNLAREVIHYVQPNVRSADSGRARRLACHRACFLRAIASPTAQRRVAPSPRPGDHSRTAWPQRHVHKLERLCRDRRQRLRHGCERFLDRPDGYRSEEHTSEL